MSESQVAWQFMNDQCIAFWQGLTSPAREETPEGWMEWMVGLPWVSKEAHNLPSKEGGVSLRNWNAHVKALQVKVWLQCRNGNRGE